MTLHRFEDVDAIGYCSKTRRTIGEVTIEICSERSLFIVRSRGSVWSRHSIESSECWPGNSPWARTSFCITQPSVVDDGRGNIVNGFKTSQTGRVARLVQCSKTGPLAVGERVVECKGRTETARFESVFDSSWYAGYRLKCFRQPNFLQTVIVNFITAFIADLPVESVGCT